VMRSSRREGAVAVKDYRTDRGELASIKLTDGSAVQLGPQSTLRVEAGYGGAARSVTLTGDGYFNIVHDVRRPFVVRTALSEIRDLGTRFVVRARDDASQVEVAVAEGLVAVSAIGRTTDSLLVNPGELARVDRTGVSAPMRLKSVDDYFAWTEGRLVFDRAPLPQVLHELSRWYDTEFVLTDPSMAQTRLTTVLRGETLSEALLVLQNALDVETRLESGRVTLSRRSKTR
jgi:transmembrane sensor